jgi:hypothetical protein
VVLFDSGPKRVARNVRYSVAIAVRADIERRALSKLAL